MQCLTILIPFLVAVASGTLVDYRLTPPPTRSLSFFGFETRATTNSFKCTGPGKYCDADCKRIWICDEDNQAFLGLTCQGTDSCNAGACVAVATPQCSAAGQLPFKCQAEGIYPDPADCKKYYYCIKQSACSPPGGPSTAATTVAPVGTTTVGTGGGGGGGGNGGSSGNGGNGGGAQPEVLVAYQKTCEENFGYNPLNTFCDKPLVKDECPKNVYPVPVCTVPGATGALAGNPSIYYVCLQYDDTSNVLYPFLKICKNGRLYAGNYTCRKR